MDEKTALTRTGINLPIIQSQNNKLAELEVKHHITVEDDQREFEHTNYWTSCCFKMDKRAVAYFSQLLISVSVCAFTIGMMSVNQDCPTFSRYSPLLTMVIGIWLPQPSLKDSKK